ncbi:MAG: GGDEF domain-containing phosphodiesterase [Xanthomonadales bacterium]|jgi:EAL domain-containing protein (putative c-di-GMP-specific phosphodiesterase class I)|nr:GGDEF domain-containing phosphodiesterase [Xanthomonadales bacterium]
MNVGSGTPLDALAQVLSRASPATPAAVALVHVRRCRPLAVVFGLAAVESLVLAVQARLQAALRMDDLVQRFGDTGLLIGLPGLFGAAHAELALQRILRECAEPQPIEGRLITPLVTVGAVLVESVQPAEVLLRGVLAALDQALRAGLPMLLSRHVESGPLLHDELRAALAQNELKVVFQPIHSLQERQMVVVEALARWDRPLHGPVSPLRFVELAEQSGLAAELTRWSLHASLREFGRLRERWPALGLALNLSAKAFVQPGLVEQILGALAIWDLPADQLTVEVTETAMMDSPEDNAVQLEALRAAGASIAIDDFGRGYSSFTYLQRFPATELKIDQSFVMRMARHARDAQLVRAMVGLAHGLGLRAIAEGVEDAETLQMLVDCGCDLAQGYFLARPMSAEQLLLRSASAAISADPA